MLLYASSKNVYQLRPLIHAAKLLLDLKKKKKKTCLMLHLRFMLCWFLPSSLYLWVPIVLWIPPPHPGELHSLNFHHLLYSHDGCLWEWRDPHISAHTWAHFTYTQAPRAMLIHPQQTNGLTFQKEIADLCISSRQIYQDLKLMQWLGR